MGDINLVAIIVAIVGSGGVGLVIREIVGVFTLARNGVSGKETKRREDIISQRDHALAERDRAEAMARAAEAAERTADERADMERLKRILLQEDNARLRILLIMKNIDPGAAPDIDETTGPVR